MTCVAWTPGMIAADSCITEESDGKPAHRSVMRKLKTFVRTYYGKDVLVALASRGDSGVGDVADAMLVRQLKGLGEFTEKRMNAARLLFARQHSINGGEYECLVVIFRPRFQDIVILIGNGGIARVVDTSYFAIGCDAGFANAAMYAGADARRAVAAAAKHGPYTSFPIDWVCRDGDSWRIGVDVYGFPEEKCTSS
jgi:hypothetical protein